MKIIVSGFLDTMSKPQRIAGYIYLPLHVAIIPLLVGMLSYYSLGTIDDVTANVIYYAIGLVFCLVAMWKYLRTAFDILIDNLSKNLIMLFFAYFSYLMLSYIASAVVLLIFSGAASNPNNEMISEMAGESSGVTIGLVVFIAPIVEEILFRGVLFGSIRRKNRVWAYIVSIVVFSLYHVWQYALVYQDATMLIIALQYIPAAYALAWSYERTNCIWIPIFVHMMINAAALTMI